MTDVMEGNSMNLDASTEMLTPDQVATILNLKRSTIYAAIAAGRLPHTRLWQGPRKGLVRVPRAALERFIAARTATPEVPAKIAMQRRSR